MAIVTVVEAAGLAKATACGRSDLAEALASLQAALGRRRSETMVAMADGRPEAVPSAAADRTARRLVSGLREAELSALAARVDRLLEPLPAPTPVQPSGAAPEPPRSWWRRLFR